ncbi:MAG: PP2C family protein-serine/threonine phosphatase [Muribaculaceae bacterium]|nr:PP2C family protein-serine/threonine phosphatase [Roseburia sp.]MCM1430785.1 PP2C family protein-serine/threonine phosphatase [Muribaculaceae bacterium]MCM1492764.1 PP2C family protein-serine/threonine phosphatase [Muribaculaceae bacterium]
MNSRKHKKTNDNNSELELRVLLENEEEANLYAVKCLAVCAAVGAASWIFNLLGIFIVPAGIMNVGMPIMIVCLLLPALIYRLVGGKPGWVKFVVLICGILGMFILSSAMPKHGVLAWAVPITISCHYYSKKLTHLSLVASWVFFSASIFIGMLFGEADLNMFTTVAGFQGLLDEQAYYNATLYSGPPRHLTAKLVRDAALFFVLPRAFILLGLSSVCTTVAGRTRKLLERQIKDSEERQRISTELDVATHIQADMLPRIFPAFPERQEFDIYATMNPAKEVGGDFYDFFMVDERHLAIVVADVSGKGVPAALFMVIGKTLIKDHTKPGVDLGEVFTEVNELLCQSNNEGLFITAFEGVLDLVTGEFRFVNAGHEMPFLARKGDVYEPYKLRAGFVLAGMEGMKYKSGQIQLAPGDKIFQYTDGVTEATNAAHELYGMQRLTDILVKNSGQTPSALLPAVKADIDRFVGDAPQFDDITMLCVEYLKPMQINQGNAD